MENREREGEQVKLPFDPRTLLIGLWRRWPFLFAVAGIAVAAGLWAGMRFGARVWTAETVLLYQPPAPTPVEGEAAAPAETPLRTLAHLATLRNNLMEVRERLELPTKIRALESAIDVDVRDRAQILAITVRWSDPDRAALIANTLMDVFLERQRMAREVRTEPHEVDIENQAIRDLGRILDQARRRREEAGERLAAFSQEHKVGLVEGPGEEALELYAATASNLERVRVEKQALDLRAEHLNQVIEGLSERAKEERAKTTESADARAVNARISQLREAINADRAQRLSQADLQEAEKEVERAAMLYKEGIVSKADYDAAVAELERRKIASVDTDEIKDLRAEMERLQKAALEAEAGDTPSGRLARQMMMRDFNLQLKRIAVGEELDRRRRDYEEALRQASQLPEIVERLIRLQGDIEAAEAAVDRARRELAELRAGHTARTTGFRIESLAATPTVPSKSNRSTIAIGVFVAIAGAGSLLVVLSELLDTRIKSTSEMQLRLGLPVLGAIPRSRRPQSLFPDESGSAVIEPFKIMARRLRMEIPKRGARVLVVSASHGEGKTLVAANMACSLGRQDERVLLMDAQVRGLDGRESDRRCDMMNLIHPDIEAVRGLGDYLSFQVTDLQEVVWPTILAGVECLPQAGEAVLPDLLGANMMKDLMDKVAKRYSICLIEASPVLPYADTETLAQCADCVLFVVRSRWRSSGSLRKALGRLSACSIPIVGAVLNDVHPLYMERLH